MTNILYYDDSGKIIGCDKRDLETFESSMPFIELDFEPDGTIFTDYDFNLKTKTLTKKSDADLQLLADAKAIQDQADYEASITAKADEIIYVAYPQKKQNKFQSQGLKITLKIAQGQTVTSEEEAMIVYLMDVDAKISSVRDIENQAIENQTALADIVWIAI